MHPDCRICGIHGATHLYTSSSFQVTSAFLLMEGRRQRGQSSEGGHCIFGKAGSPSPLVFSRDSSRLFTCASWMPPRALILAGRSWPCRAAAFPDCSFNSCFRRMLHIGTP